MNLQDQVELVKNTMPKIEESKEQVAFEQPKGELPVKRGRGRPKGSKNKPKVETLD
jgi:hypothetical protein